jgi:hypothetical protein
LIKAYLKDGVITLAPEGRKKAEFTAGAALTTIGEKSSMINPYTFFDDFEESTFQTLVRTELDRLFELDVNSPRTLVSALDKGRTDKLYTNRMFQMSLETVSGEVVLAFYLESARNLLALELVAALSRGKPLKKCEHCGGYFFPSGRSDSVYCDRVGADGFSCKKIGAHRLYRKHSRSDRVKKLYDKITKHNRYLKSRGQLSENEFARWMAEASLKHAQFQRGELSEDLLIGWLSEDLAASRPPKRNEISDYLL